MDYRMKQEVKREIELLLAEKAGVDKCVVKGEMVVYEVAPLAVEAEVKKPRSRKRKAK